MDRADRIILIENSIKKQKLDEIFPALVPLLMNVGRMAVSAVGRMAAKGGASLLRSGGNQLKNMAKSALTGGGGGGEAGGGGGGGGGGDSGQPQFDVGSAAAEEESPDAPKVAKSGVEKQ